MVLIDKAALLNKIAKEVHYDSEHSLEMYAKMLSLINDAPEVALTLVDANGNAVDCGRRIDADKLKEHYSWREGGSKEVDMNEAKKLFDTIIDLQQTVDAEPVRHGKWTHTKGSNMRHDYTCSLCGCRISGVDPFSLSATAYYYCPECGAQMDEVEDG